MLAPGASPKPPTWAAQASREVVAVEVGGGDDVVLVWPQKDLLQHGVGDPVFEDDFVGRSGRCCSGLRARLR